MPNLFNNIFGLSSASQSTQSRSSSNGGVYTIPDLEANFLKLMGIDSNRIQVTSRTAMALTTFFSAVNLISDIIAALPYGVFRKKDDSIESADNHPLQYLLHTRPNALMSPFVFKKMMFMNMLVHGYAIAHVIRNGNMEPVALRPYPTKDVQMWKDDLTDLIFFKIINGINKDLVLKEEDVIFLKDVAFDGTHGVSVVDWQRHAIKLPAQARAFAEKNFEKGQFMAGFVTAPLTAKDGDAAEEYKRRIVESLKGDDFGGFGLAVLGQGADYKPVTRSFVEAQVVQILEYSDKDIAKMFRVPLVMLGDTDKQTSFGKGIDSMYILLTNNVINPKVIQMEEEVNYKCLTVREQRQKYYTKFNERSLLRGDASAYAEYATKMIQNGIYTINELRSFDEMSPVEGGDRNWIQRNNMPIDRTDELIDKEINGNEPKGDDGNKVPADQFNEN